MKLSLAAKNYIFTSPSVPSLSIRIASISTTTCLSNHTNTTEVPVNVPEPEISSKNVAQFRKGPGGRASFSGNVVTVFGFTGFSGRAVVNRLAKQGCQLILPYRCDPYFVKENKVVGELGQILFFPFELKDETSIRKAVKYSNVVINMIGAFINTPNYSMHDANAKGAAKLARICREMSVERFIHVSALGADPEHKTKYLKNGQFLRSKGLGELAVRETFPEATIVRPAVMYGQMDHFIHKMTTYFRRCPILGYIYVYNRGNGTYKMPTYVNDFALAIARIATDPAMAAKTFELVGPYCYEFSELVDFIYAKAGCRDEILVRARRIRFPDPWYWLMAAISALNTKVHRVRGSRINWEWLDYVEATSDVLSGGNTLGYKELGITPQNFENMGAWYAFHRRFSGQFDSTVVQLPDPPLPLRSPPLYKPRPQHSGLDKIHTERRVFGMGTA